MQSHKVRSGTGCIAVIGNEGAVHGETVGGSLAFCHRKELDA